MISVEVEYINNNTVDNNDISKEIVTEEKSSDVSLNNATVSNDKNAAKMVINRRIKNIHVQCNICMNHITAIAVGSCNHHICMDCMLRLRCHYQYKSNVCCICKQECHRVLVYTVPNLDMDVLENKNENMKIHKRNKSLQYGHIVKRFNKYVNKLQEKERKDRNRDRKPTKEKSGANSAAYDANVADINQYIHQSICIPYKDVIFHEFTSSSVRFSQEDGLLPFHYQCEAQESGSGPMKKNSESCVSETALTNESSVDAVVNGNIESTSVSLKGKVVKHTLSAYAAEFNPYVRINKSDAAGSTKSNAAGITMTEVTLDNIGASIAVAKPIPAVLEWYIDYTCDIAYCNLNHASFMELINANGNTISNAKGKLVAPVHSSSIMSTEQFKLFVRDVSAKLELKCPLCSYESSKRHKNSCREKQPLLGNGDDGIVVYRDLKQLLKHIQKHNPMPTQPSTAASPSLCLCTVCVEHSNMMLGEIPIYCNRKELEKHQQGLICHSVNNIANSVNIDTDKKQKTGDGANSKKQTNRICNPAMVGGHPKCVFCNTLFYDAAKLYTHMRQEHYSCPCANCGSQNLTSRLPNPSSGDSREIYTFYVDAEALYEHYACEHYTCGDANCKGLVFVTHQEYNLHRRQVHHEFVDINALPTIMSHGNSSNVRGSTRGNRKAMVASCVLDMTRPNPNVKLMGNARNSRIRDGDYSPTRSADSASMNSNLSPNTITQTTQVPAHMRITGHVQGSGIFIPQKTDVEEAGAGVRSGSDYKSKKTPKPYDTHSSNTNIEFSTDLFPTLTPNSANKTNADSASHGSVHHPLSLIGLQQQRNAEKALQKRLLAEEAKAEQSLLEERNERLSNALDISDRSSNSALEQSCPFSLNLLPPSLQSNLLQPLYSKHMIYYALGVDPVSGRMLNAEGEGVRSKGSGSTNYMQELLKIEKKYNQLVGACPDANNNASAHSINFPPCNTKKRRFIYEYGRYYAVLNFEFDESPNRYVNAVKTNSSKKPSTLLSQIVSQVNLNAQSVATLQCLPRLTAKSYVNRPVIIFSMMTPGVRFLDMGHSNTGHMFIASSNKYFNINGIYNAKNDRSFGVAAGANKNNMYVTRVYELLWTLMEIYKSIPHVSTPLNPSNTIQGVVTAGSSTNSVSHGVLMGGTTLDYYSMSQLNPTELLGMLIKDVKVLLNNSVEVEFQHSMIALTLYEELNRIRNGTCSSDSSNSRGFATRDNVMVINPLSNENMGLDVNAIYTNTSSNLGNTVTNVNTSNHNNGLRAKPLHIVEQFDYFCCIVPENRDQEFVFVDEAGGSDNDTRNGGDSWENVGHDAQENRNATVPSLQARAVEDDAAAVEPEAPSESSSVYDEDGWIDVNSIQSTHRKESSTESVSSGSAQNNDADKVEVDCDDTVPQTANHSNTADVLCDPIPGAVGNIECTSNANMYIPPHLRRQFESSSDSEFSKPNATTTSISGSASKVHQVVNPFSEKKTNFVLNPKDKWNGAYEVCVDWNCLHCTYCNTTDSVHIRVSKPDTAPTTTANVTDESLLPTPLKILQGLSKSRNNVLKCNICEGQWTEECEIKYHQITKHQIKNSYKNASHESNRTSSNNIPMLSFPSSESYKRSSGGMLSSDKHGNPVQSLSQFKMIQQIYYPCPTASNCKVCIRNAKMLPMLSNNDGSTDADPNGDRVTGSDMEEMEHCMGAYAILECE